MTTEADERHKSAFADAETLSNIGIEGVVKARLAALSERFPLINGMQIGVRYADRYARRLVSFNCYLTPAGKDFYVKDGSTFDEVLSAVEAELEARTAEMHSKLVRGLALKLIETTADFGSCTAAQLRIAADVQSDTFEALRPAIEAEANKLATSGQPFRIDDAAGDNGAPEGNDSDDND